MDFPPCRYAITLLGLDNNAWISGEMKIELSLLFVIIVAGYVRIWAEQVLGYCAGSGSLICFIIESFDKIQSG